MNRISYKRKLPIITLLIIIILGVLQILEPIEQPSIRSNPISNQTLESQASEALLELEIKGRAPKTGYDRALFSNAWAEVDGCDMRNYILQRDLVETTIKSDGCTVLSGILHDPYSGKTINFIRGKNTSSLVQIDHVVSVSDAWQKGAQNIGELERFEFYNDPLNLLAVDGATNQQKGDNDAASWLPRNKSFRCDFIARQIAVKTKYNLWITSSEYSVMSNILKACPTQTLPDSL